VGTEEEVALDGGGAVLVLSKGAQPAAVEVREERASASYMLVKRGRIGEGMRTEGRRKAERGVGGRKSGAWSAKM
jgi:hypothetical protein